MTDRRRVLGLLIAVLAAGLRPLDRLVLTTRRIDPPVHRSDDDLRRDFLKLREQVERHRVELLQLRADLAVIEARRRHMIAHFRGSFPLHLTP